MTGNGFYMFIRSVSGDDWGKFYGIVLRTVIRICVFIQPIFVHGACFLDMSFRNISITCEYKKNKAHITQPCTKECTERNVVFSWCDTQDAYYILYGNIWELRPPPTRGLGGNGVSHTMRLENRTWMRWQGWVENIPGHLWDEVFFFPRYFWYSRKKNA